MDSDKKDYLLREAEEIIAQCEKKMQLQKHNDKKLFKIEKKYKIDDIERKYKRLKIYSKIITSVIILQVIIFILK